MKKFLKKILGSVFNPKVCLAFLDTIINVVDNSIAAAIAGLSVDLFIPTIGNIGRLELIGAAVVLLVTSIYLKK